MLISMFCCMCEQGIFLALRFECSENMRKALLTCTRKTMPTLKALLLLYQYSIYYDFIATRSSKFSVLTAIREGQSSCTEIRALILLECALYRLGLTIINMMLTAECSVCEVQNFSILPPHRKLTLHQNHVFTDMKHQTNRDRTPDIALAVLITMLPQQHVSTVDTRRKQLLPLVAYDSVVKQSMLWNLVTIYISLILWTHVPTRVVAPALRCWLQFLLKSFIAVSAT